MRNFAGTIKDRALLLSGATFPTDFCDWVMSEQMHSVARGIQAGVPIMLAIKPWFTAVASTLPQADRKRVAAENARGDAATLADLERGLDR